MENKEETGVKATPGGGGDTGIFKCLECNSIFKRRDHLGRHVMTQHDENSHRTKCPLKDCDTEMVRRDHLRRHISQVHKVDPSEVLPYSRRKPSFKKPTSFDPTQRFKCVYDGCDAELSRKDHLCRHIKNIHKADPREVIGHMYKQPRSNSASPGGSTVGAPVATSTPNSTTSPTGKSKKRLKKKRGGITNAEDSSLANNSSDHHHHHPNNHQGHHPHQPHPSTLSDYDYGADFSYGGSDYNYEGESETEDEEEEEEVLCFLCCYSFYPDDIFKVEDLSDSFQFHKFISEIFMEDDGASSCGPLLLRSTKFLSSLKRLTICSGCYSLISVAMDRKLAVDEVEITVRRLQIEILSQMRALQQRLTEYALEMKSIKDVVSGADEKCMEHYLEKNVLIGQKVDNSMVLFFRERIVAATNKLQEVDWDVQVKCGQALPSVHQLEECSDENMHVDVDVSVSEDEQSVNFDPPANHQESAKAVQSKDNIIGDDHKSQNEDSSLQLLRHPIDEESTGGTQGEIAEDFDRFEAEGDVHQQEKEKNSPKIGICSEENDKADSIEREGNKSQEELQQQEKSIVNHDDNDVHHKVIQLSEGDANQEESNLPEPGISGNSDQDKADSVEGEQNDIDKSHLQEDSNLQEEHHSRNSGTAINDLNGDEDPEFVPESDEIIGDFGQPENAISEKEIQLPCTSSSSRKIIAEIEDDDNNRRSDLDGEVHQKQNDINILNHGEDNDEAVIIDEQVVSQIVEDNNELREFYESIGETDSDGDDENHQNEMLVIAPASNDNVSDIEMPFEKKNKKKGSNEHLEKNESCQLNQDKNTYEELCEILNANDPEPEILSQCSNTPKWSKFKKNIIKEIQKRSRKQSKTSFNLSSSSLSSSSPFQQQLNENCTSPDSPHSLKYNPETDELFIGQITVRINEQMKSLLCSQCSFRTIKEEQDYLLPSKQKVKRMMHSMEHHVQRNHTPLYLQKDAFCELCNQPFINEDSLYNHIWSEHTQKNEKNPSQINPSNLLDSAKSATPEMVLHQCSTCGKRFTLLRNLKMHERLHLENPERDICLCATCGKLFLGKATLARHKETCLSPRKRPRSCEQEDGTEQEENAKKKRKLNNGIDTPNDEKDEDDMSREEGEEECHSHNIHLNATI